jgi:hypothetical protein
MAQAKMPPRRTWLWFVLIVLANYVLGRLLMPDPGAPVTVPYTLFKEEVGKGLVQLAPRENPYLGGLNGYAGARPFSEATAAAIDAEVLKIIGESYDEATRLLNAHRELLDALVDALLARETLNEQEILEVTGLPPAPALDTGLLPVAGAGNRGAPRDGL